jgi:hypothetical protein
MYKVGQTVFVAEDKFTSIGVGEYKITDIRISANGVEYRSENGGHIQASFTDENTFKTEEEAVAEVQRQLKEEYEKELANIRITRVKK